MVTVLSLHQPLVLSLSSAFPGAPWDNSPSEHPAYKFRLCIDSMDQGRNQARECEKEKIIQIKALSQRLAGASRAVPQALSSIKSSTCPPNSTPSQLGPNQDSPWGFLTVLVLFGWEHLRSINFPISPGACTTLGSVGGQQSMNNSQFLSIPWLFCGSLFTVFIATACLNFNLFKITQEGKYQEVGDHFISNKCLSILIYPVCDIWVR